MPHVLRREVAIHDECPNKFVPSKQCVVGQMSAAKSRGMTYCYVHHRRLPDLGDMGMCGFFYRLQ
jgi:hypothetical protein